MNENFTLALNINIETVELFAPFLIYVNDILIKEIGENGRHEIALSSKENTIEIKNGLIHSNFYNFSFNNSQTVELGIALKRKKKSARLFLSLILFLCSLPLLFFLSFFGGKSIGYGLFWKPIFYNIEIREIQQESTSVLSL